jgi:hypothetical protein
MLFTAVFLGACKAINYDYESIKLYWNDNRNYLIGIGIGLGWME